MKLSNITVVGFIFSYCLGINVSNAQEYKLIQDKPGTFKTKDNGVYGEGLDSYYKTCQYTVEEQKTNKQKLDNLVTVFRQTPVLAKPMGFDELVEFLNGACDSKFGYGIPATIKFVFQDWFTVDGKLLQSTDEPPQWRMEVNQLTKHYGAVFDYKNSVANEPTNPAYNEARREEVCLKLSEFFYPQGKKETVSNGIDRYNDMLVFYNPERPVYWKNVTIREIFDLIFEYTRLDPDLAAVDPVMQYMKDEYNRFSDAEKNGFAYLGNPETISRIGSDSNQLPILKPNPDYWNKNLNRTVIQFLTMELPPEKEVERLMNQYFQNQDGEYYVYLMLHQLDINSLVQIIDK